MNIIRVCFLFGMVVLTACQLPPISIGEVTTDPSSGNQPGAPSHHDPAPAPVYPPQIIDFSPSKPSLIQGESVRLHWETRHAVQVFITGIPGMNQFSASGTTPEFVPDPGEYKLTANNERGDSVSHSIFITLGVPSIHAPAGSSNITILPMKPAPDHGVLTPKQPLRIDPDVINKQRIQPRINRNLQLKPITR